MWGNIFAVNSINHTKNIAAYYKKQDWLLNSCWCILYIKVTFLMYALFELKEFKIIFQYLIINYTLFLY